MQSRRSESSSGTSSDLKIAISGKSGCGNSTVSGIVADRLGLRLINYTFHTIADETGVDFRQICRLAESDTSYDLQVDERQIAMASSGSCVLGSRLAVWLLRDADLKVYLKASLARRAQRIRDREDGDLKRVIAETCERDVRDRQRYLKLYSIDVDQYDVADLIIDTDDIDQYEVAGLIVERAAVIAR